MSNLQTILLGNLIYIIPMAVVHPDSERYTYTAILLVSNLLLEAVINHFYKKGR